MAICHISIKIISRGKGKSAVAAAAYRAGMKITNEYDGITHRSYKRQGKEQIPTIHLGQEAHQMEKRGIRTERGDRNKKINGINNELRQLKARSRKLKDELYSFPIEHTAPSMSDVVTFSKGWEEATTQWER
ncbi:MAG: MobA/MobL family protein [Oscillospiraceae bacterium]|nr:MobA/MobL family protein [Oscillospiraceae bacterium]